MINASKTGSDFRPKKIPYVCLFFVCDAKESQSFEVLLFSLFGRSSVWGGSKSSKSSEEISPYFDDF